MTEDDVRWVSGPSRSVRRPARPLPQGKECIVEPYARLKPFNQVKFETFNSNIVVKIIAVIAVA
ncbi:hypothetical protein N5C40_18335, partial [Pseudomonas fulva]|uniref:hypothetical protein n=1 Tax=Pseudomonas fulva TaxID=47880 RepID=UPI0024486D46